jgi:hypothetical protein
MDIKKEGKVIRTFINSICRLELYMCVAPGSYSAVLGHEIQQTAGKVILIEVYAVSLSSSVPILEYYLTTHYERFPPNPLEFTAQSNPTA